MEKLIRKNEKLTKNEKYGPILHLKRINKLSETLWYGLLALRWLHIHAIKIHFDQDTVKKFGQMDKNTTKNCHLYASISQNSFQSQKVIYWTQRLKNKLFSLRKSQFARQLYSLSILGQNAT